MLPLGTFVAEESDSAERGTPIWRHINVVAAATVAVALLAAFVWRTRTSRGP